jgi:hypothetical protein
MKLHILIIVFSFFSCFFVISADADTVRAGKKDGCWQISINDKPWELKGVGCAKVSGEKADYLKMAADLGATTVRTWGADQLSQEYLDKAAAYGLKVNVGLWLSWVNPPGSAAQDASYLPTAKEEFVQKRERERQLVLGTVKKFKDHPAVLMWNLGNEVIYFSQDVREREAFCRFLASLIQEVKTLDPTHPVSYVCAGGWDLYEELDFLERYVPGLDLIGINQFCPYAGMDFIETLWRLKKMRKPYYMGEFGPIGPWTSAFDSLGQPIDNSDPEKAKFYDLYLHQLDEKRNKNCLGGYAYLLGDSTQDTLTWWSINYGPSYREAYHQIYRYYTGKTLPNKPPRCLALYADKRNIKPGDTVTVLVAADDPENDALTYECFLATSQIGNASHNKNSVISKALSSGTSCGFTAPEQPGIYRFHVIIYDGKGNCATQNLAFQVVP